MAVAAVAVTVVLAAPLAAQEPALSLEQMYDGVNIGTPSFSPDGRSLVFTSNRSGRTKIWRMDRDGTNARVLVDDSGTESSPVWSPDGAWVAFVRFAGGVSDIWLADRDGGSARRVTDDEGGERALAWAPDGRRLAFMSDRSGTQDVYVVEISTGGVERLTTGTMPWDEVRFGVAWSPDGRWIAFVSNRSEPWADDVWLVEVATGTTRKATADLHVMTTPRWSPDGNVLAFNAVQRSEFWYGDMSDIYLYDVAAGMTRKLAMNTHVSDGNGGVRLQWGPDGDFLYFRYDWQGDANLWSVPVTGGVATQITYDVGRFGNFSVAGDGRSVAYVRTTPARSGELHRVDLAGGPPVALTDWNPPIAGLTPPRKITFRSSDGLHILGYEYLPPAFDPQRRYPALVQVHGGGNNAYGNGFHPLEQLLSHRGYVVLAIEYRGSAGHGRAFQDLALGEWAAGQGWDAVAAARYLKSRPYSNGRVGIYGGSYGGIMTLAAVTRDSEPFDAAAPFRGIYDWENAYEHGDRLLQFWIIEGHGGFRPGERPELFERTASLRHLDGVKRDLPFLIVHGERDRRAPFQQSQRLVDALRARGNPVEFHSYPEDGHGLRRSSRLDAYDRLLRFFDRHLKSDASNAADPDKRLSRR